MNMKASTVMHLATIIIASKFIEPIQGCDNRKETLQQHNNQQA